MKGKITIDLSNLPDNIHHGCTDEELKEFMNDPFKVRLLLCDALGEFRQARMTPEEYMDRRYPGDSVYSGERREKKAKQVALRIAIAEIFRNAVSHDYEATLVGGFSLADEEVGDV